MAASAHLIWPGALDAETRDDPHEAAPAFRDPNWANWISLIIDDDCDPILRSLGCGALMAYSTEGLPPEEIEWASPAELEGAAQRLSALVRARHDSLRELVDLYEDYAERNGAAADLLVEDLNLVADMARWLASSGKTKGAFELAF